MTESEYKSECCGADVEEHCEPISTYGSVEKWIECSKCHNPCTVRKEEGDE